jgi:hypothetical protein
MQGKTARSVVFPEPRGIRRTNSRSGAAAAFAIVRWNGSSLSPTRSQNGPNSGAE